MLRIVLALLFLGAVTTSVVGCRGEVELDDHSAVPAPR